jgi:hypothetical protein
MKRDDDFDRSLRSWAGVTIDHLNGESGNTQGTAHMSFSARVPDKQVILRTHHFRLLAAQHRIGSFRVLGQLSLSIISCELYHSDANV